MSIWFQVVLICVSIITSVFLMSNIRKARVQINDALFWVFFCVLLLVFSIFPGLAEFIASALGIVSAVNFIFLFVIFLLMIHQFQLTAKLSKLDTKVKELVQYIALKENGNDDE